MSDRWQASKLSPDPTQGTSVLRRTLLRVGSLRPDRGELVDAVMIFVLTAVALWGLHSTFTGWAFLVVGLLGCLLGIATAHVAHALKAPVIVLSAVTVGVLFVLGSVFALRSFPLPTSFEAVFHQVIFGWKDLLTTLPPVDGSGPLLVIPYLLGLITGTAAQALATRSPRVWPAPAVLVLLLAAVILLGSTEPASLLIEGGGFAMLLIAWVSLRGFRGLEPVQNGSGQLWRIGAAVGIVAVAVALAVPIETTVLASEADRVVLRDRVQPPFDVGKYPSPLAGFRRYTEPTSPETKLSRVYDKELLRVDGAPAGTLVRIATLDAYDDRTWGAANKGGSPGQVDDTFQRVSSEIANPLADSSDPTVDVTVTVGDDYSGVWLPTVGAITSLHFGSPTGSDAADTWRYNLATSTAVLPGGVQAGDVYTMTAALPDDKLSADLGASGDVTVEAPSALQTQVGDWSRSGGDDALRRALAIAEHLRADGAYTNGKAPFQRYTAGHYLGRLTTFVGGDQIAGNDEQYAATMALMANQVGIPARVVLGAALPEDGVVRGKDVHAWVELRVADGSWRKLPTESFMDKDHEPDPHPPTTKTDYSGAVVPPPAPVPPASTVGDPADGELEQKVTPRPDEDEDGAGRPGWIRTVLLFGGVPLLVLAAAAGIVLALKARKRHRRRAAGRATTRISGGWAQVLDRARDLGVELPVGSATRREQAQVIDIDGAAQLATTADDHVFGPGEPADTAAHSYWQRVDRLCADLGARVSWPRRVRAALNPATLRPTAAGGRRS